MRPLPLSRRLVLVALASLLVAATPRKDDKGKDAKTRKPPPKPGEGAVPLVTELYRAHMPFVDGKGVAIYSQKPVRARFFSPELIALIEKAEEDERKTGVPVWNADPLTDSQDPQVRDLRVTLAGATETSANVLVRFEQYRSPTEVTLRLVRLPGGWRVDDIQGGRGDVRWTLRGLFAPVR